MQFFDVLDARHSVRAYRKNRLETSLLQAILRAASFAPFAGDLQAYKVLVAESAETKAALAKAAFDQRFIAEAAAVLVFFADSGVSGAKYGERGRSLFSLQDASIAAAYVQLAAAALKVASCWVGAFDERAVAKVVGAPKSLRPIAILPLGEPAETPSRPPRRSLAELVVLETFDARSLLESSHKGPADKP